MKSAASNITTSTGDRLSFTLFFASVLHGILIFGINFKLSQPSESAPSVTVTLATANASKIPEEADFIAQTNQVGSGTLEQAKQITTDQLSPFSSQTIEQTQLLNEFQASHSAPVERKKIVATTAETRVNTQADASKASNRTEGEGQRDIRAITREIASLNAKLDKQRQQYAKRPRERVLTSVSAKAAKDAAYLNAWTRKVEQVGNENFPREALRRQIVGSLRLQALIKWDGSLIQAKILESSGYQILDNAALQIIHRSAPFLPFPPEIRKDTDQLVVIRTWHFDIRGLRTSQ
ncbi:MAG: protein TonB [Cellvibrionaceae bacterium]|jgi:protein TonB